jgi:hypothetical protein
MKAEEIAIVVEREMGDASISAIYKKQVLSQRTRQYELRAGGKPQIVEVLHTLLGIELKIGKRRLLCPDLATARYLAVFARFGCEAVAVPYDITQISRLADELESIWHRMILLADHLSEDRSARLRGRVKQCLVANLRTEIEALGGGGYFPQFIQETKQRH